MYAVILAGGIGTRLWPRSREDRPKQFSDITGSGLTMIQDTAQRLEGIVSGAELFVVTGAAYAGLTAAQLPQMPVDHIVLEPSGRNTAPAIGLACLHLRRQDPGAVMAILPADHVILNADRFRTALRRAVHSARAAGAHIDSAQVQIDSTDLDEALATVLAQRERSLS